MMEPVSTNRGSKRWELSSVRWVFITMKTSMKAASVDIAKKVTMNHCERSLGVWCLMKSRIAAAKDRNTCAQVAQTCMMDVRLFSSIVVGWLLGVSKQ